MRVDPLLIAKFHVVDTKTISRRLLCSHPVKVLLQLGQVLLQKGLLLLLVLDLKAFSLSLISRSLSLISRSLSLISISAWCNMLISCFVLESMPVEFSLSHWLSRPRQPILSQRVPGVADTTTCEIKTLCDAVQAVQAANMAADQA